MRRVFRIPFALAAAAVVLACGTLPARAGWSEQPTLVEAIYGGNEQLLDVAIHRDAIGDFFLTFDGSYISGPIAQRVRADGAPLWPYGLWIGNGGDDRNAPPQHVSAPDGHGGMFHLGTSFDFGSPSATPALVHLNASGVSDWGANPGVGLVLTGDNGLGQDLLVDGAGAWVAYDNAGLRLERFVDGHVAPGWNPLGRLLGSYTPALASDGAGGALLFTTDGSSARVLRVRADSTLAPGWPGTGLWLGPASTMALAGMKPVLIPSGADHFIAAWTADASSSLPCLLQRFGLDGTVDPAWPAGGLAVGNVGPNAYDVPDPEWSARVISDDQGGVHVTWRDSANAMPRWAHVLSNGTFAPGHGERGVAVLPAQANFTTNTYFRAVTGRDGGLIYAWTDAADQAPSPRFARVGWRLSNGALDPEEPDTGRVVITPNDVYLVTGLEPDHAGGAWLAWRGGGSNPAYNQFLYMNHMARAGVVLDALAAPAAPRSLALSTPYPNPAHGAIDVRCTLPDDRPATLSLYDVGGRLARAVAVSGAGTHAVHLGRLESLPPGVYLVRLAHGGASRSARVVLMR